MAGNIPNKNIGHFLAFSEEWFAVHQKNLLWLLNSRLTKRWFRFVLRIRPHDLPLSERIFAIAPNRFSRCPRLIGGHLQYTTDFRTHPKYAKRLYYAFKPLWWAMHAWDWGLADRFPSFEQLSFGFDTLTQYPAAGDPVSCYDCLYWNSVSETTWATIHNAASSASIYPTVAMNLLANIVMGTTTNNFTVISRTGFLFDTSSIATGAIISDATFSVYGNDKADPASITPNLALVSFTPTSTSTTSAGDYSKLGTTDYATRIAYSAFAAGYNDFSLNATGIAAIAKGASAVSKFGLRNGQYDADNVAPTWVSGANNYMRGYFADQTGTTNDPKLVVNYSTSTIVTPPPATATAAGSAPAISNGWWLSDGTAFLYRAICEIANPTTTGDRSLKIKMPAPAYFLYAQGKMKQSNYNDIRVTKADGLTLLNCSLDAAGEYLSVNYPSLAQGRTYVYVYYGNDSCGAPTAYSAGGTLNQNVEVTDATEETPHGGTTKTVYCWGDDTEMTYLDSDNTPGSSKQSTYFGSQTSMFAGYTYDASQNPKQHLLFKFLEAKLPLGTVSAAKLHLYYNSGASTTTASGVFKLHRFENYGVENYPDTYSGASTFVYANFATWVSTGWSNDDRRSVPTWNSRSFSSDDTLGTIAWETAGAFDESGHICKTNTDEPTVTFDGTTTDGYKSWDVPAGWVTSWLGDYASQGMLLKRVDETTGTTKLNFDSYKGTNKAVFEVTYSVLDTQQLNKRKITTNTFYNTNAALIDRYTQIPSENEFAVYAHATNDRMTDIFYITPSGRISRVVHDLRPKKADGTDTYWNDNSPMFGFEYDPVSHRFVFAGNIYLTTLFNICYSDPYTPTNWTVVCHPTQTAAKSIVAPYNDVIRCPVSNGGGSSMGYLEYTIATDSWSTAIEWVSSTFSGTVRTLATQINNTDVMTAGSPGTIQASGAIDHYLPWGVLKLVSGGTTEFFYYSGLDTVNNRFTGVVRGAGGYTAQTWTVGTNLTQILASITYITYAYDPLLGGVGGFHCTYTHGFELYSHCVYFNHLDTDDTSTIRDAAGNILTLPLNNTNEPILGIAGQQNFISGTKALSNGDIVIDLMRGDASAPASPAGTSWTDSRSIRRGSGSSTWNYTSITGHNCGSIVEIGTEGKIKIVGIETKNSATQYPKKSVQMQSDDYGATWGTMIDGRTVDFSVTEAGLWYCSVSADGNLNGHGLQHLFQICSHGAVYLDRIGFQTIISSPMATATADALTASVAQAVNIVATLAEATSEGIAPTIHISALINAAIATAQSVGNDPLLQISWNVQAALATATADALASVTEISANIQAAVATATAEGISPTVIIAVLINAAIAESTATAVRPRVANGAEYSSDEPMSLSIGGGLSIPLGKSLMPHWNTAGRPANPRVGEGGLNTQTGNLDVWNGSSWSEFPPL